MCWRTRVCSHGQTRPGRRHAQAAFTRVRTTRWQQRTAAELAAVRDHEVDRGFARAAGSSGLARLDHRVPVHHLPPKAMSPPASGLEPIARLHDRAVHRWPSAQMQHGGRFPVCVFPCMREREGGGQRHHLAKDAVLAVQPASLRSAQEKLPGGGRQRNVSRSGRGRWHGRLS